MGQVTEIFTYGDKFILCIKIAWKFSGTVLLDSGSRESNTSPQH